MQQNEGIDENEVNLVNNIANAAVANVRNCMLVAYEGRGELGKLKTLTYGFTNFTQR
jgi:hypothetical protein